MKRTIVALAALVMLAVVGSASASTLYRSIDFNGLYVETFQGPTTGTPIAGICALTFDGISSLVASQSFCYIVNGSGSCYQNVSGSYAVHSDGTGTINGTLSGGGCSTTPFNESFVIQQLNYSTAPNYQAWNVLFTRTDVGAVASGALVPQTGGPFKNYSLLGTYDETISGTTGGNTFASVCEDTFNGAGNGVFPGPYGAVNGSCTVNIATIGGCNYSLSGEYGVSTNASAFNIGTLTLTSGAGGCPSSSSYAEVLRILDGTYNNGVFSAGEVTTVEFEPGVIATGTYLPQE